jgi:hypothetical protein
VQSAGYETPDSLWARIYNLKESTAELARREFSHVRLEAGYVNGAFGTIFSGTVRTFGWGRESATDDYLDIFCSDGDELLNYGFLNQTLAPGTDIDTLLHRVAKGMGGTLDDSQLPETGGILPRGRVLFGLGKRAMRSISRTLDAQWYVENGRVIVRPLTDPLEGDPIEINQESGMLGVPESTIDGVRVRTLLNPNFRIGGRVRINSHDIAQRQFAAGNEGHVAFNQRVGTPQYYAHVGRGDGLYSILVHDLEGDTRAEPWYSDLTLLSVDPDTNKIVAD